MINSEPPCNRISPSLLLPVADAWSKRFLLNSPCSRPCFAITIFASRKKWELPFRPGNLYSQYRFFRSRFTGRIVIQVGCFLELFDDDAIWAAEQTTLRRILPRRHFLARCGCHIRNRNKLACQLAGQNVLWIMQSGELGRNLAQRIAMRLDHPCQDNNHPTIVPKLTLR